MLRRRWPGISRGRARDAVGAVPLDAGTAQNAAENGETDADNQIKKSVGKVPGDVGIKEEGDAGVNEDGEYVAESASRHGSPP
jgi:hypothetical protein